MGTTVATRRFGPRTAGLIAVAALCGMTLSACLSPFGSSPLDDTSGFPIFDEEQSAEDALPPSFEVLDLSDYDLATSRFSGSHEGIDYYLLRQSEDAGSGYCIAADVEGGPVAGCGGGPSGSMTLSGGESPSGGAPFTAQLVAAPAISADGWLAISDNVRVPE